MQFIHIFAINTSQLKSSDMNSYTICCTQNVPPGWTKIGRVEEFLSFHWLVITFFSRSFFACSFLSPKLKPYSIVSLFEFPLSYSTVRLISAVLLLLLFKHALLQRLKNPFSADSPIKRTIPDICRTPFTSNSWDYDIIMRPDNLRVKYFNLGIHELCHS